MKPRRPGRPRSGWPCLGLARGPGGLGLGLGGLGGLVWAVWVVWVDHGLACADRQYFSTDYVMGTLTEVSINDSYVSMFWYK